VEAVSCILVIFNESILPRVRDKRFSDRLDEMSKGSDSCSFPSRYLRPGIGIGIDAVHF
jgi:hypothetical protein